MDLSFLVLASFLLNAPDLSPVAMERECHEEPIVIVGAAANGAAAAKGLAALPIVTYDGKRERTAALFLAAMIRDITGVRPEVQVEVKVRGEGEQWKVKPQPALHVEKCTEGDSFRVISKGGSVWFLGRSDFAVYDWCERVLGVRYYDQVGGGRWRDNRLEVEGWRLNKGGITSIVPPSTSNLQPIYTVPAVDYADGPVFTYRNRPSYRNTGMAQWLKLGGSHRGGVNVHSPHHWFKDEELKAAHPNIFARQPDGSRGEMPLLCYGNPETLAYYEERIDQHIAGLRDSGGIVDTNRHVITVSPWDCRLECSCEHCKRLFDPGMGISGSGSPIVWGYFLKELAQWAAVKHPDYLISFLPYLNMCDVPEGLDLTEEGNCEAMVCSMPGLALFKEPSVREHEEELIREWARVTGRPVLNWHYSCWPREFTSAPYLFGRTIAEHYQRMAPYEVGSFINGGMGSAAETLSTYVWHKCLWNPNIDVDAVYDEFARRMFGAAAKPMRELMRIQEEGWARAWGNASCRMSHTMGVAYTEEDVREMRRLLREAMEVTAAKGLAALPEWRNVRWWAKDFVRFFAEEEWYRAGRPALDHRREDGTWELVEAFGGETLKRHTRVSAQANEEGVAIRVWCEEPNIKVEGGRWKVEQRRDNSIVQPPTSNLQPLPYAAYGDNIKQDTVEIFLDASGTDEGCCHRIMLDVRNRMSVNASTGEWTAEGVRHAVTVEDGAWVVDVFIPYSSLLGEVARASGSKWRWNVVRWHPGPKEEKEWSRLSTLGSEWNQDRDAFSDFDILY